MGDVWLATDEVLERRVAIKELVMSPNGEPLSVRRERTLREARAAAGIRHPGVVDIYDVFEEEGRPWIVMAYIRGRALRDLIEQGTLGERELAPIGIRVLEALTAAHRAGVLHRDVKPANIVISEIGEVFLIDFGIAHIGGAADITAHNGMIGTLDYMAPERIDGRGLRPPSDLWSLGVTFFHALEGYSPFLREGVYATIRAIQEDAPPTVSTPGPLADAIVRLLRKDPGRRMDARELRVVLRSIINGRSLGPPRDPRGPMICDPRGPHRPTGPSGPREPTGPEPVDLTRLDPVEGARLVSGMTPASASRLCAGLSGELAREVLTRVEPGIAGPVLLGMPRVKAASVLAGIPAKTAGGLMDIMAASPAETVSMLRMLKAGHVGRAVDYMDLGDAAALVTAMRPGEAARILAHAHARTVAGIVSRLAATPAATPLMEAMTARSVRQMCVVLGHVPPSSAAALVRPLPAGLTGRLLDGLAPTTRAQVLRHLGRS